MPSVTADTQPIALLQTLSRYYTRNHLLALLDAAYASIRHEQAGRIQPTTPTPLTGPPDHHESPALSAAGSVAYGHQAPIIASLLGTAPLSSSYRRQQGRTPTLDGSSIRRRHRGPAATRHVHSPTSAPVPGAPLECTFCKDWNTVVPLRSQPIQRPNDMQRHVLQFHQCNTVWACAAPGCGMMFDLRKAYEAHAKASHPIDSVAAATATIIAAEDVAVEICPRAVWACGFENCANVYEAADNSDPRELKRIAKEYRCHVIGHIRGKSAPSRWSYARLFRNLLVHVLGGAWKSYKPQCTWEPASTLVLRKLLETKHVDDLEAFTRCVIELGAGNTDAIRAAGLAVPERKQCRVHRAASRRPATVTDPPQQPAYSAAALSISTPYSLGSYEGVISSMAATPENMSQVCSPDAAVRMDICDTMAMPQYVAVTTPDPMAGHIPILPSQVPAWDTYGDLGVYYPQSGMPVENDPSQC